MSSGRLDAGVEVSSFRDRSARVFYSGGDVYRALNGQAYRAWTTLRNKNFFAEACAAGRIVGTEEVPRSRVESSLPPGDWAGVLRHDRIPLVTYPYEWSFGMLKDAALLHLELLAAALAEGFMIKDSTSFNIQWRGRRPVFIDVSSFEPLVAAQPWIGYRQFCELFLNPLLLTAYKGVSFQPWLRGSLEGLAPGDLRRLMSARDLVRPGILRHVYLHAGAERRSARATGSVRRELEAAGFGSGLIAANVAGLTKLIEGLAWTPGQSTWSDYAPDDSYAADERRAKTEFVEKVLRTRGWDQVWDFGCNRGEFSRLAAPHARLVLSLDSDAVVVERLYQDLKRGSGGDNILPMVGNLSDPSPGLGWRGTERGPLDARGRPDLVLCLALVHHVVIGGNIPLGEFVEWLAGLTDRLVIEFVGKDDARVRTLLREKSDQYLDYDRDVLERCLARHFANVETQALSTGTRVLYYASRP